MVGIVWPAVIADIVGIWGIDYVVDIAGIPGIVGAIVCKAGIVCIYGIACTCGIYCCVAAITYYIGIAACVAAAVKLCYACYAGAAYCTY